MATDLAARIARLEDIEAIRQLKADYCAACDADHDPNLVVPLFTENAIWEANGIAYCNGQAEIRTYMSNLRASGRIRNSAHHAINPRIEIDGNSATGHWRLIMLYTANPTPAAGKTNGAPEYHRIIGWYQERYSKENGRWRFSHLKCTVEESAPYSLADSFAPTEDTAADSNNKT